ncbi:ABC transporter ATP-binding protein [Desulfobaculum bizertense]|uniref:ATP-binding cassette, subfamily B n=1 Tax=Desulfobaculum bizertense DSM 18034 TaxID=1121442 RepID=A0A1T4VRW4_9BACT|nr:ABC transporter ATP-binding protein [Desulfobaculum bizertense]SKA67734.1 ATP-binding cassette, subfamily B [Desulfobaculum bizertense DSM 18034]
MRNFLKKFAGNDLHTLNKATVYAVAEGLCAGAPLLLLFVVLKKALDESLSFFDIAPYLVLLLIFFAAQTFCSINSILNSCSFAYGTGARLRLKIGEHLRKLPLGYFKEGKSGNTIEALLLDVFNVELASSTMYNKLATSFIIPVLVAFFMFCINTKLTLLIVSTVPLALFFFYFFRKKIDARSTAMLSSHRNSASAILEYVQGIRTIKSFNMTGPSFQRLDVALRDLRDQSYSLEATIAPLSEIYACIASLGFPLLLFFGTRMYASEEVSLAVLLFFMILSLKFYQPLMGIAPYFSMIRHLSNSAQNINTVLTTPAQPGELTQFSAQGLPIRFDNVSFSYGDRQVLHDIQFDAKPGTMTALVGPSGAGKTTISHLLARFWDVDSGKITIGSHNVREIAPDALLSQMTLVMQDTQLWNDTVMNNIRFGNPQATDEDVKAAAKAALCHDFICRLPLGYDTVLGENGSSLSGGEQKRIAIARAILKDAPIVILDEATASLDPENEHHIQQAFSSLASSKTVFAIAHKLSTIRTADQILFIENGRIAERGNFESLLAQGGRFKTFWDLQQKGQGWKIRRTK